MSSSPPVVFYQYEQSPFAQKIAKILAYKGIRHHKVEVPRMPPRVDLADRLGIRYRRIPVLAIGRDVYIDTSLIQVALEKYFPESAGYPTLFPLRKGSESRDTGLVRSFLASYVDRTLFPAVVMLLPWDQLPEAFVKDRSAMRGTPIDPQRMVAMQPTSISTLMAHLSVLEQQLADGREWLMDTRSPGLADLGTEFVVSWLSGFPAAKKAQIPERFPHVAAWTKRVSKVLAEKAAAGATNSTKISGEEAGKLLTSASYDQSLSFDDEQGKLLGLSQGATVSVTPEDSGRDSPTTGVLVGLTTDEVVIETTGDAGTVRVHFPRLTFAISQTSKL